MRRVGFIVVALLLWQPAGRADSVDDYILGQMRRRHIPGLALAVVRDGHVLKCQGYGVGNVELGAAATPHTLWRIGSITKQFTATAIMMLVQENRLRLDEPIRTYLDGIPAAWSHITVRDLLTHTSGLPNSTELADWDRLAMFPATPAEVIKACSRDPLEFGPGERWEYCNTGYYLLGRIIEKVSGQTYGSFLQQRILDPLGMSSTRLDDAGAIIPDRASGYDWHGGCQHNADYLDMSWLDSAGAILSSAEDMVKWDAAIDSGRLLSPDGFEQMWKPTALRTGEFYEYGLGWFLHYDASGRWISHDGRIGGFTAYFMRHPRQHLTVIVLCNQDNARPRALARQVAGMYVPELAPPAYPPIADNCPRVAAMVKDYFREAAENKLDPALFTHELWSRIAPELSDHVRHARTWGPVQSIELVEQGSDGDETVLRYRVHFADSSRLVLLGVSPDLKIARLESEEE